MCCFSRVRSRLPPASREAEGARDIIAGALCLLGPLRGLAIGVAGSTGSSCIHSKGHILPGVQGISDRVPGIVPALRRMHHPPKELVHDASCRSLEVLICRNFQTR